MNQSSIISLLSNTGNTGQTSGLGNGVSSASGAATANGAATASGANGVSAVQSFQAALNGFMSGQAGQPLQTNVNGQAVNNGPVVNNGLPTTADGKLDLEAMKNMSQEELASLLSANGITPEMLLGVASQLQITGQLSGASVEQQEAVQTLRNNIAATLDPQTVLAIETGAKNASLTIEQVLPSASSANGEATVKTTPNALLGDDAVKSTIDTLQKLAQILGISPSQNGKSSTPISTSAIAANEVGLGGVVKVGELISSQAGLAKDGVMPSVPSDAGEFKAQHSQNIASTVLNAGNATQVQNQTATNATAASNVSGDTKDIAMSNLTDGNANSGNSGNAGNGNGQNAGQNAGSSNPLLEQILNANGKSNPFALTQQNGSTATPSLQGQGVEMMLASQKATPQAMQTQSLQVASIFDGAAVTADISTSAQALTGQGGQLSSSGQTLANGLATVDGQATNLAKESAAVTRPMSPHPQTVSQNIGMQVSRAVSNGQTDFTVRIDPPELGRVNIKISFGNEGSMRAMVTVDTREALNLLQRDAHVLERALGDLGTKLDQNSLNFSLKDQNSEGAQDGLSAKNDKGNGAEFEAALEDGEDIMNDILPFIDTSRALDIRI